MLIREYDRLLRTAVDTAVDGVILIDSVGQILMFNPACERLFGYAEGEVLGQDVKLLMPPPFREQHDRYLADYRRTGEKKIIGIGREAVGLRKDGSTFPIFLSVGEAKGEGGESTFVGVIHDLTEHKRLELMKAQEIAAIGQLSGGIAHDFNNIFTVIIGNAESLIEKLTSLPEVKRHADTILKAALLAADLTQRLLAFSRRQILQPEPTDCRRVVDDVRELLRRTLREDIEISASHAQDVPPALIDRSQLQSALLNLALNARDAMPKGGHLTFATSLAGVGEHDLNNHRGVSPGHYVMVTVTDDGCGMPPEIIERVFEPFFTTKEVGRGSGLGLSMVYGFVKQSNGDISIQSQPGRGTTIRLYLPVAGTKGSAREAAARNGNVLERGNETVMVVEDDPLVRTYAVSCLESLGYTVLTAPNGRVALERLKAGDTPHIILTDIVMPGGVSGLELAEQARALRPGLRVILTSGYPLESLVAHGKLNAATSILNKPYRKSDLAVRIREALDICPTASSGW